MESLAVVVAVLFLIGIFAGPIAIALSSNLLINALAGKPGFVYAVLRFMRKFLHIALVSLGTLVGAQFLGISGLPIFPRLVGLTAVITSYIALRREYFPEVRIIGNLFKRSGNRGKNGRSSGNDGHGPEGQS
ncbi:hypothetical protein MCEMZLE14_01148 [Candidatus Nanopelagicaceae bacterium]